MDMDSKKEEEYALVYIAVGTLNYSYQLDVRVRVNASSRYLSSIGTECF